MASSSLPLAFRVDPREEAQSLVHDRLDSSPEFDVAVLTNILKDSITIDPLVKGDHQLEEHMDCQRTSNLAFGDIVGASSLLLVYSVAYGQTRLANYAK
ncbi:hypothetical protein GOP47_0001443 [Adiantum capillus-veneris]|uniref:Uncharacterized protein n=1 Tax=Adiantum capillus-veneris TaxID=13818 RepID=A0A9D4ZQQ7_ADICA|nr:hypothetical protein GOP47_0001443 [Adiantum capillus-veneris]